jgi:membrane protease YdiL (CAAX protease family)
MRPKLNASARRRALIGYFVLTYLISWAIEIPLALSYQQVIAVRVPFALHYLASFGPLVAAVIVTLATESREGVRRLFSRLIPPTPLVKAPSLARSGEAPSLARSGEAPSLARSGEAPGLARHGEAASLARRGEGGRGDSSVYFLFAVVAPLVLFALLVAASAIVQGAWPDLRSLGRPDYLPEIGILPTLGLWLLTFGLGEEVGWRGFALPRLQAERPALSASLLLGALWAGWHLPALFYRDTYIAMGLLVIPMLLTVAAVGSVVYTWLYNGTGGNLLLLILFHGLFDFFSVWPAGVIGAGPVMTVCMVFWAVRVFKLYGPATLCAGDRVTI